MRPDPRAPSSYARPVPTEWAKQAARKIREAERKASAPKKPATREQKVSAAKKACKQKAAHRQAQQKYVAKNPQAQNARVKASQQKNGKPAKTAGTGKHGHQKGRPVTKCNLATSVTTDIDLTGDGHGHHVPGTPYVYSHGWKPLKGGPKTRIDLKPSMKAASRPSKGKVTAAPRLTRTKRHPRLHLVEGQGEGTSAAMGKEDPALHRHLFNLANSTRTSIYAENHLVLKHPDVAEHELLDAIKKADDPKTKAELIEDLHKRAEILQLTLAAIQRADIDAKRENTRDRMSKFDERLRAIKGGAAILAMRDRLLSDKTLDRLGFLKTRGGKAAKDVAIRVATATALGLVFGPIGAAAGVVGGTAVQELIHSLVEQSVVHAGIEHLMEKHVVDRAFKHGEAAVKYGTKKARAVRAAKREKALHALEAAQAKAV